MNKELEVYVTVKENQQYRLTLVLELKYLPSQELSEEIQKRNVSRNLDIFMSNNSNKLKERTEL